MIARHHAEPGDRMHRAIATATALLLALPALAADARAAPFAGKKGAFSQTYRGKAQAPVTVTTRVGAGTATVTVRFHSASTGVAIEARGLDGLVVTSPGNVLTGGRFQRGEAVTFDVAFTEGPGRSQLVVSVSGRFGPATRSAVAAFPVGQPTAEQQKGSEGATTDSTGERIKLLPAETR